MSNGTYAENFDSLSNIVGANIPWTNNVTLAGWYASKAVAPNDVTNYSAGTGSSTTGSFYSFGSSGSTERALGSLASSTTGDFAYGVRFVNDTGFDSGLRTPNSRARTLTGAPFLLAQNG